MNDDARALRWHKREEFAEKVKAAEEKDVTDEELKDLPVLSEDQVKAKASKLSQEEMIANLKLIRDLLQDDEEEVSDEERKLLTTAHDKLADLINNQNKASIINLEELHYCRGSNVELVRMCWGRPCGQNIGRRARSLTPKGMKEGYQRRGSSQAAEYTLGKYSFKYRPKNLKEAKRKVRKANTSRARWAAAALILAVPSLIPGVRNVAFKKYKQRSDDKRTAKRQYHSLKLTKSNQSAAVETVTASAAPRKPIWTDELEKAIKVALDSESVDDYREGDTTLESAQAAEVLDKAIRSSKLSSPLTLYRAYDGVKDLKGFKEDAYFVGSTSPVKGDSVVKVDIPAGVYALALDDYCILLRGMTVTNGKVSFAVESPVAMMRLWRPEEFFNPFHSKADGRFTSGKGGGGGGAKAKEQEPDPEAEAARKQRIKNILVGAAVVAGVGLLVLGVRSDIKHNLNAPAQEVHSAAVSRQRDDTNDPQGKKDADTQNRYTTMEGVLLNHSLRGTTPSGGKVAEVARLVEAEDKALGASPKERQDAFLKELDTAFHNNSVAANGVTLHRGMTADKALLDQLKPGETFTDDGFISTAHSRRVAKQYGIQGITTASPSKENKTVLMSIKTQQGTQVMSGYDDGLLKELVLNRGTTLKINSVRHCPDGICRIQAEVVE